MSDLFQFFKENEEKLHEMPGEKTWRQLELRLERQRKKRVRRVRFLQIGVVALVIFLLLLAAVLVWYFNVKK